MWPCQACVCTCACLVMHVYVYTYAYYAKLCLSRSVFLHIGAGNNEQICINVFNVHLNKNSVSSLSNKLHIFSVCSLVCVSYFNILRYIPSDL